MNQRLYKKIFFPTILGLFLSSCHKFLPSFPEKNDQFSISREDVTSDKRWAKVSQTPSSSSGPTLPSTKKSMNYMWYPSVLKTAITMHITPHVAFSEVVRTLATIAQVPLVIQASLSQLKGVHYQAHHRSIYHILQDLCRMRNIQVLWKDQTLFIQDLKPYHATYNAQFLGQVRSTQSHVFLGNQGISDTQNTNQISQQGHVQSQTEHKADFWKEIESVLKALSFQSQTKTQYSLNAYTGLITLWGDDEIHRAFQDYLEKTYRILNTQILIEARVIEISLDSQSKFGIDWSKFFGRNIQAEIQSKTALALPHPLSSALGGIDGAIFYVNQKNFQALLNFIDSKGPSKTLSNPRVLATHNQPTVFWVGTQKVFFTKTVHMMQPRDEARWTETTSKARTIPVGLSLLVHPSLNLETKEITLYIQPSLSEAETSVKDPSQDSVVPVVNVRKMDAVITLKPNQMILIGGLMREYCSKNTSSVPLLSAIPLLGALFKHESKTRYSTELVILVKVSLNNT